MKKVKMTQSVGTRKKGKVYEMTSRAAAEFVKNNFATELKEEKEVVETKEEKAVPETKKKAQTVTSKNIK
jgi:hypothetical protein